VVQEVELGSQKRLLSLQHALTKQAYLMRETASILLAFPTSKGRDMYRIETADIVINFPILLSLLEALQLVTGVHWEAPSRDFARLVVPDLLYFEWRMNSTCGK